MPFLEKVQPTTRPDMSDSNLCKSYQKFTPEICTLSPTPVIADPLHHLRMASVVQVDGLCYAYVDFIRVDSPFAPGTIDSEIHLYVSKNFHEWEHKGPIVERSLSGIDSYGCVNVDVIQADGFFYLYYTGVRQRFSSSYGITIELPNWKTGPSDPNGLDSTIIVAKSKCPQGPFRKIGPVLEAGSHKEWDEWKVLDPHIVKFDNKFYMYYKGFNSSEFKSRSIGLAISDNPEGPFRKYVGNPIVVGEPFDGVEVPVVFSVEERLGMILMGFPPRREWVYAESSNGTDWFPLKNEKLRKSLSDGIDCAIVKGYENREGKMIFQTTPGNKMHLRGKLMKLRQN